jgi:hypothetical protein
MESNKDFQAVPIVSLDALINTYFGLPQSDQERDSRWIFRGEGSHYLREDYRMQTSLEREALFFDHEIENIPNLEKKLLREFRRRLYHYTSNLPDENDWHEWMALMQHFGAPTRLLDWTYSYFIAAYFALEKATLSSDPKCSSHELGKCVKCIIWGLQMDTFDPNSESRDQLVDSVSSLAFKVKQRNRDQHDTLLFHDEPWRKQQALIRYLWDKQHNKEPHQLVIAVNSFRLNERHSIQQGVFLMPGDVSRSFEHNLTRHPNLVTKLRRFEIHISPKQRNGFLKYLNQMNINRASLFPGLAGFAESLKVRIAFDEVMSSHEGY